MSIIGTGNALSSLGLTGNTGTGASFTASRTVAPGSLSGKTLTSRPDRFDLRRARFHETRQPVMSSRLPSRLSSAVAASRSAPRARQRDARNDIIHLIRISTDSEINVAVKPGRLCLRGDRYF